MWQKEIINCLDITDEHDYLFVGYNSGNINIYDLKKNTCKYSANKIMKERTVNTVLFLIIKRIIIHQAISFL